VSRPVTERMAQALKQGAPRVLFVEVDHPSGTGYFCSNVGSLNWNGHTWVGVGPLGSVTPVKQSSQIEAQDITFALSGVDADILAKLADDVHNRAGLVWLGCLDDNGNIVADPVQLVDSELDTQSFVLADDGTATINIVAHTGFYILDRAVEEAWTPENQHWKFPGDTGLDMIPALVNQNLQWTPT